MTIRRYSDLIRLSSFKERFEYLKLGGRVGEDTFGFERYINQGFYRSQEWRHLRDEIIFRDSGCDLAMSGFEIYGKIIIHHMNPINSKDILEQTDWLMNPAYLVCVSLQTHNAIHYGDENILAKEPIVRRKNDMCPWK